MPKHRIWAIAGAVVIAAAIFATTMLKQEPAGGAQVGKAGVIITSDWVRANALYGVSGRDARNMDFTGLSPADLSLLGFDSNTKWPDRSRLPQGFRPDVVLEAAKDPGLKVRELHRQGITGKGIRVAVIDKNILPEHQEFAGRIKYVDALPEKTSGRSPHFHGMAAASILAGTSVGVASDAFLYYFAVPDDANGFRNYLPALEQILTLNDTLPEGERIRVVSVSWSPSGDTEATKKTWSELVERARAQGVEVVYSETRTVASYLAAGVLPGQDRNDLNGYDWAAWVSKGGGGQMRTKMLGVPASYRTTASIAGPDAYVYWGDGGQSWAIPYVAGLLTLGLQVNPSATFDDLYLALEKTAAPNARGVRMVNPTAYIDAVKR
jgi:serine protease AprX